MTSLAIPPIALSDSEARRNSDELPELSDAHYLAAVLGLPADKAETHLEDELLARAHAVGISASLPSSAADKRNTSSALSASTVATYQDRVFSAASDGSASSFPTPHSSIFGPPSPALGPTDFSSKPLPKFFSFVQYEKYLTHLNPNLDQPKFRKLSVPGGDSGQSLFSISTRKSFSSVTSGWKSRMRLKKKNPSADPSQSCVCCRDDFSKTASFRSLPCGHTYCAGCLKIMIHQSITDESKMPPRCCTQPIPSAIIQGLLDPQSQQAFLKAVAQFSTPWESRIFCPNATCAEFVPPNKGKVDPKHPFTVTCRKCHTRVCVMCKQNAHPVGRDCPEDWELEAVLKMGEKSGWRRCYKCKNLVELAQGCTHVTCRCKAQFCYICGGVWDPTIGCPNICSGEEELERRRQEDEKREAEVEAAKADLEAATAAQLAKQAEAARRSQNSPVLQSLQKSQEQELQRFVDFMATSRDNLKTRQSTQKTTLLEKHVDQGEKMTERHNKTVSHLEDRQIAAEMELRSNLEQSERSIKIRLKHMEAYCDGLGQKPIDGEPMPARVVTERDLRELGQQYNLRDDMQRVNQSKINVMRDRQTKAMEELMDRQEAELDKLAEKKAEDLEDLAAQFAHEDDMINAVFTARQVRLTARWNLAVEILCKELEQKDNLQYATISAPTWPASGIIAEETPEMADL